MALLGIFEILLAVICYSIGFWLSNRYELLWNWPFLGMLPSLVAHVPDFHDWNKALIERSGGTFLFKGPWFSNMDIVATCDPANVKHTLSTNFYNYPKGDEFKEMFDVLGDGIFNADSDLWKHQRKNASALINHDRFHSFLVKTTYNKLAKELHPVLELLCKENKVFDFQDLIDRFTFDVAMIFVTGYDPESVSTKLPKDEFSIALDYAEQAVFYRHVFPKLFWKLQRLLGIGKEQKLKEAKETLDRMAAKYISMRREQLETHKYDIFPEDLLASYISQGKMIGSKSQDEFLRDVIVNFLVAGRVNSLTWLFWLLSKNQRAETRIREELKSIASTGETTGGLQLFKQEKVNKLIYLHAALCETLRLYPPVVYEHKKPLKPDVLPSGHHVDPKMKILYLSYVMGRLKSLWGEDCMEFKPERWISEEGRLIQQSPYKFLTFNAGPRTCLGKEIALTEMKAVAAFILHNYQVKVIEGHVPEPTCASIILHIKNGLMVRISRR
ncbi:alkane hydroxylase MAH1 [Jatropha curcas]|uniref:alkane hydroxylase MAH1 n=1 Tax=Jatropha curcas TaxID=180498 RepID=UPI001893DC5B|nr:alkane hydroxylase MAH1 [Jatropha curcas]